MSKSVSFVKFINDDSKRYEKCMQNAQNCLLPRMNARSVALDKLNCQAECLTNW